MWSRAHEVAAGDTVIIWLVSTVLTPLDPCGDLSDPRSHPATRRDSWQGLQHKVRQLQAGRLRWGSIRLKDPFAHRKRVSHHPKAHS